jgi:hypothetical protein
MKNINQKASVVIVAFCHILLYSATALPQQMSPTNNNGHLTASEALVRYEQLLQTATDQRKRFYLITRAAPAALAASETAKAKSYAVELLKQAAMLRDDWNYGNAIHVGNIVLGQIAVASKDLAEAKRRLLEAGKTPGSTQLSSFGPEMLLAKELLEKGEREVVLNYLDLCDKFWSRHADRLEQWRTAVKKGEMPDFRSNLGYALNNWRYENWDKLHS